MGSQEDEGDKVLLDQYCGQGNVQITATVSAAESGSSCLWMVAGDTCEDYGSGAGPIGVGVVFLPR